MKNKGFTLIELLAVIVVLAIIALIATPIIMNIIGNIQEGANARSVEGYMRAYEAKYYAEYAATGKEPNTNSITLTTGDYNGAKVDCGHTIRLNSDNKFEATCTVNNQTYKYENGKATKVGSVAGTTPNSPSSPSSPSEPEVGFPDDVTIPGNQLCVLVEGNTAGMIGAQYVCELGDNKNRVFYVLDNSDNFNISLIMDRNIGEPVAWCASDDKNCSIRDENGLISNENGPKTAEAYLKSQTENKWDNSKIISITLPTYDQIYKVNDGWDLTSIPWIHGYLDDNFSDASLPYGYWTGTAPLDISHVAFHVYEFGLERENITNDVYYGIRPVITVAKTDIGL